MRHINRSIQFCVIAAALFAVTAAGILPETAGALKQTISLTATPAIIDTGGRPGGKVEVGFELTNGGGEPVPIHMGARDSQVKEGQTADLVRALSAKGWISFVQSDFILQPNETKTVTAVLAIPEGAAPGGHYADLVVQPLSLEGSEEFVTARPQLVVQTLVSVAGKNTEELEAFLKGPSTVLTGNPAQEKLKFEIKNWGTIHELLQPKLRVWAGGKTVGMADASPLLLFPQESGRIEVEPPKLPPGIYRMELKLTYGASRKIVVSPSVLVIALPFSPVVVWSVPLLAVLAYGFHIRRRLMLALQVITKGEKRNT